VRAFTFRPKQQAILIPAKLNADGTLAPQKERVYRIGGRYYINNIHGQ
jgi:hypothetical protein